ncbi:MAG: hypothetical protein L3J36_12795 [Rhodobacteraceae bacterium]|nr:hypothetical protein [Paracoccaceae bacterium]
MKSIAEYFRDLASDDRYFGAEPPQPDADMLARIAQRDMSRRVEAHSTDTGTIVLRAAEPDTAPDTVTQAAQATAAVAITEPVIEIISTPDTPPEVAEADPGNTTEPLGEEIEVVETPDTGEADSEENTDEPSDEKVEIIDVPTQEVAQEVNDKDLVEQPLPEITEVTEQQQEPPETDAAPKVKVEDVGEVQDTPELTADDLTEGAPKDDVEIDKAQVVAPARETIAAVDSIAAKLQRIRAVVSQNDSMAQMGDYTEDQHADGFVADAAQDISEALEIDDETLTPPHDVDDTDDQVSLILNQIDADAARDTTKTETAPKTESEEDFFGAANQPEIEPVDEDVDDKFSDADISGFVSDQVSAPLQARVVKVKRTDLEAAIASGQLEQMDDGDDADGADIFADQAPDQATESSLSAEDEADLMRELAAVEEEMAVEQGVTGEVADHETDEALDFDNADPEAEMVEAEENIFGDDIISDEPAHAALQQSVSEDEDDLSRLMNAANEKLDDPETSSRHETYSQLRAAVAVAEAERNAGGAIDAGSEDEEYRQDLAQVVRPRRPSADGARVAARPVVDTRPAPLKLVAEQRVDAGADTANLGPVRPRRVMGDAGTPDSTGTDRAFAEFANRVGATDLPDLLEAAAAYLSFVEGHERFSRPQLMNKVRLIKQDGYNREDGLRSFGQLLRDGKIEKKGGGRFAASGDIGFRPDDQQSGPGAVDGHRRALV